MSSLEKLNINKNKDPEKAIVISNEKNISDTKLKIALIAGMTINGLGKVGALILFPLGMLSNSPDTKINPYFLGGGISYGMSIFGTIISIPAIIKMVKQRLNKKKLEIAKEEKKPIPSNTPIVEEEVEYDPKFYSDEEFEDAQEEFKNGNEEEVEHDPNFYSDEELKEIDPNLCDKWNKFFEKKTTDIDKSLSVEKEKEKESLIDKPDQKELINKKQTSMSEGFVIQMYEILMPYFRDLSGLIINIIPTKFIKNIKILKQDEHKMEIEIILTHPCKATIDELWGIKNVEFNVKESIRITIDKKTNQLSFNPNDLTGSAVITGYLSKMTPQINNEGIDLEVKKELLFGCSFSKSIYRSQKKLAELANKLKWAEVIEKK